MIVFLCILLLIAGMLGGFVGIGVGIVFDRRNSKVPSVWNFLISQAVAVLFSVLALSNLKFGVWPYFLSEFASLCVYFTYFCFIAKHQKS